MPVNLAVGQLWECRVRGVADGQAVENVLHYRIREIVGGAPTSQQLVNAFATEWDGNIHPLLHESYAAKLYEARKVLSVTGTWPNQKVNFDYYAFLVANDPGLDTNDAAPGFVAASARKIVAAGTPRVSGGIRLGPIAENKTKPDPDGNSLTDAFAADVLASLNTMKVLEMVVGVDEAFVDLAILETARNKAIKPYDPVTSVHVVDAWAVSPYVSSQISRKKRNRAL